MKGTKHVHKQTRKFYEKKNSVRKPNIPSNISFVCCKKYIYTTTKLAGPVEKNQRNLIC